MALDHTHNLVFNNISKKMALDHTHILVFNNISKKMALDHTHNLVFSDIPMDTHVFSAPQYKFRTFPKIWSHYLFMFFITSVISN